LFTPILIKAIWESGGDFVPKLKMGINDGDTAFPNIREGKSKRKDWWSRFLEPHVIENAGQSERRFESRI